MGHRSQPEEIVSVKDLLGQGYVRVTLTRCVTLGRRGLCLVTLEASCGCPTFILGVTYELLTQRTVFPGAKQNADFTYYVSTCRRLNISVSVRHTKVRSTGIRGLSPLPISNQHVAYGCK